MDQPRFVGGRVKGTQLAAAAFVLSLVLLLAVGGITIFLLAHKTTTNADFATELRDGLVESCEQNGNPLREVLIEEQEAAIESPHDPRIHALLPDVPQSVIQKIVAEGNAEHRERIKKLQPVACHAQYPPKP
jgi:hypothetical protein